ncbi:MAG: glycosyltransferase [Chloroflexi bacterium]|nr:glycosyltransferase [Chloroflexota bacterium]
MKVLHVSDADLPARRFNGYDLIADLATRGVQGRQAVLRKSSRNPDVVSLFAGRGDEDLQFRIQEIERRHSINNLLFPWGRRLAETAEFKAADVVHYHLIHNQVISLYDLKWLFGLKPSVWTFHDPWPLTGHCVHPMGCEGWLNGCDPCPFLDRLFPLLHDHADQMWRAKKRLFSEVDVDVVVASEWMRDMVRRSPVTSHLENVHLIPFGIDTRLFPPDDAQASSRRRLGIPGDDFVVMFRASTWDVKGLSYIVDALAASKPTRPTTLLTVGERNLVEGLRRDYRVVELGWVDDRALYPQAFSACDVFLMPSLAEAFGLMAVEAMAAGRPVVCFEGTALPAVTHAPDCGIAVAARDHVALRAALDRLAGDPSEGARRGRLGAEIAAEEYGYEKHLDAMAELYGAVLERQSRQA